MLGLVLADDLILLWVFWEFTTVTSFLLIQQVGPKGRRPAIRTFVVTGAGGLSLLAAVTPVSYTHLDVYKRQGYVHDAVVHWTPIRAPVDRGQQVVEHRVRAGDPAGLCICLLYTSRCV